MHKALIFLFSVGTASAFSINYAPHYSKFSGSSHSIPSSLSKSTYCFRPKLVPESGRKRVSRNDRPEMMLANAGYGLALITAPAQPLVVGGFLAAIFAAAWYWLTIPSRTYVEGEGTVGKEYDAWTEEGILEYYWVSALLSLINFSRAV